MRDERAGMIREERFERIKSQIALRGTVDGDELAALLKTSRATIRRDLDAMQEKGFLRRTHGGATTIENRDELPFQSKLNACLPEKRAIGVLAASLIQDGQVIGCTGGTTVIQVIRALREKRVTVVTNAINVAMDLAAAESVEVVVTGGTLRTRSYELVGHIAESTIRNFRLDIALIGVDGLDFTYGLSTFTITEAQAAAMYIDHAREVWVVADHTKIGRTVPGLIAPLSRVHRVITDANVGGDAVDAFAAAGVPLSIASV